MFGIHIRVHRAGGYIVYGKVPPVYGPVWPKLAVFFRGRGKLVRNAPRLYHPYYAWPYRTPNKEPLP